MLTVKTLAKRKSEDSLRREGPAPRETELKANGEHIADGLMAKEEAIAPSIHEFLQRRAVGQREIPANYVKKEPRVRRRQYCHDCGELTACGPDNTCGVCGHTICLFCLAKAAN